MTTRKNFCKSPNPFLFLSNLFQKIILLPVNDYRLIKGCIDGKRAAQAELFDRFSPGMMNLCMRYAKNREEAEEIMLDGFYRVFKYIGQFRDEGSFEGWMKKIMVNTALQKYTPKSALYPVTGIEQANTFVDQAHGIQHDLAVKELLDLVQSLPTMYRLVFNLYVFEGYKHREIADMLDIAEGTSKSNLSDARGLLQKALLGKKKMKGSQKIKIACE